MFKVGFEHARRRSKFTLQFRSFSSHAPQIARLVSCSADTEPGTVTRLITYRGNAWQSPDRLHAQRMCI